MRKFVFRLISWHTDAKLTLYASGNDWLKYNYFKI